MYSEKRQISLMLLPLLIVCIAPIVIMLLLQLLHPEMLLIELPRLDLP